MASQPPRQLTSLWVWLLALLLLALLVWVVGRRVGGRQRPEIGVTGGSEAPLVVEPSPTPAEREMVERKPLAPRVEPTAPERAEPSPGEPVPASPSPLR